MRRALLSVLSPAGSRARLSIFSFHSILECRDALRDDEPDREQFRQILECIRALCNVLPLGDAIAALKSGTLPPRAAAITFDDGYRNNLMIAKPLLVAAGLPATVFIAVDAVQTGIMWNDLIIEGARRWRSDMDMSDLGFRTESLHQCDETARVRLLISGLKYRPMGERVELATEIFQRACNERPMRLMLSEAEVTQLQGDGIELGAHTIHHPILTSTPDDVARSEIVDSRAWLRDVTGQTPELFAYPNGEPGVDYDQRHVTMVREAGFRGAVSTRWGAARADSQMFELPRFLPWERSQDEFASRIVKVCAASYAA